MSVTPTLDVSNRPTWAEGPVLPRLGRYIVGPELGRGGMGVVHEAWDPLLCRRVALKYLLTGDPLQAMRFLREAQAQAKVDHSCVCKVFEVSAEGERPYIAMQYLEGRTLGQIPEASLREKAVLMAEVAGALHAAHRQGLIHRDIKPSNILVEGPGPHGLKPYLMDFGLARSLESTDLTLSWGTVGTPAFMSPEQVRGDALTPASDIFGLGATFYAVFAGRPPHEATTLVGLMAQQAGQRVMPLCRLSPGFPRDLQTILLKCLEHDPQRRYESAFELEEDLRRWLAGEPIRARPVSPLEHAWRKIRRHKTVALSLAGGITASLILVGWNLHAARRARAEVALAQSFGLRIREVEQLLRIERMLTPHDIRPAEQQVRDRMTEIRSTMAKLGAVSAGPGHYATGRGHLALGEYEAAQQELDAAWAAGYQTPDVSYALGSALLERYLQQAELLGGAQETRAPLWRRYGDPGLKHLKRAEGKTSEEPAYREAQVAMLEGDYPKVIERCRKTFESRPWMYEAKLLEAHGHIALTGRSLGLGQGRMLESLDFAQRCLREANEALAVAKRIAPSDERIYAMEASWVIAQSLFQADSGAIDLKLFERSEAAYPPMLVIRADNPVAMHGWFYSRVRHAMALLRLGRDPRPILNDTLRLALPLEDKLRGSGRDNVIGYCQWQLADALWRRGQDPRPMLREAMRRLERESSSRVQALCIEVDYLTSHGVDPTPLLSTLLDQMRKDDRERWDSFYHFVLWAHVLLSKTEWEISVGRDPGPTLDLALQRIDRGIQINPRVSYQWAFKAQFLVERGLNALRKGQSGREAFQAALEAGRRGMACGVHYRTRLALAGAHYGLVQEALQQGGDPFPHLKAARQELAEGFHINPTDYRLHIQAARVELLAARAASNRGEDPTGPLAEVERICKRGLAVKGDCTALWFHRAQAQRGLAEWRRRQGRPWESHAQQARLALYKARVLNPQRREAEDERTALERLSEH